MRTIATSAWMQSAIVVLLIGWAMRSFALPIDNGEGEGTPAQEHALACIEHATVSFTASPAQVSPGTPSTLMWSVRFPKGCSGITTLTLAGTGVPLNGTLPVAPMATTTYSLYVQIPQGTGKLGTATISVSLPAVVHIDGSSLAWRSLLVQALGTPQTKVVLAASVDMDMSYLQGIPIERGVMLTSELPRVASPPMALRRPDIEHRPLARDAGHLGPRLYTRTRPQPLFEIVGDNVLLEGFRLQGPDFGIAEGDDQKERGIMIMSQTGIEIREMEFSGWGGQAIYVGNDDRDHRHSFDAAVIHDNFFHHNQHEGGEGYGVEVKHGAFATIERNVFDFNRHAISGGQEPGTGYLAQDNLILKGGGFHECYGWPVDVYCHYTQQFDVHGDRYCYSIWTPGGMVNLYHLGCGNAGEEWRIIHNAFQYTRGDSIKVRGNPSVRALVQQNVFASSRGDAITQNGNGGFGDNITKPIEATGNTFNFDSYGRYGVCDFDGDGKDDLFLATGVSWWYMSSAKMHWVYLFPSTETLDQVGLGDFDGDHLCDVFSVHANDFGIYSAGRNPWQSLGTFSVPFSELAFGDFNSDGIQDIFRRAPNGQWYAISPGHYDWIPLQSSSLPLSALRFGDFNHDGVTDVIAVANGHWSVSWSALSTWQPLNPGESSGLSKVIIADLNGDGIADIARYNVSTPVVGRWEVSWGGSSAWQTLKVLSWPETMSPMQPAFSVFGFAGRFNDTPGADLVSVDFTRMGQILDLSSGEFAAHSLYAY